MGSGLYHVGIPLFPLVGSADSCRNIVVHGVGLLYRIVVFCRVISFDDFYRRPCRTPNHVWFKWELALAGWDFSSYQDESNQQFFLRWIRLSNRASSITFGFSLFPTENCSSRQEVRWGKWLDLRRNRFLEGFVGVYSFHQQSLEVWAEDYSVLNYQWCIWIWGIDSNCRIMSKPGILTRFFPGTPGAYVRLRPFYWLFKFSLVINYLISIIVKNG